MKHQVTHAAFQPNLTSIEFPEEIKRDQTLPAV